MDCVVPKKSSATSESILVALIEVRNLDFQEIAPDPHEKKNAAKERSVSKQELKLTSAQPVTTKSPVGPGL
jgi:hypothetical protein